MEPVRPITGPASELAAVPYDALQRATYRKSVGLVLTLVGFAALLFAMTVVRLIG